MKMNYLTFFFGLLLAQGTALADVIITASFKNDALILSVSGESMTAPAFFERYVTELAVRSKSEPVSVVLDLEYPIGKFAELRGLMDKIGISYTKYYVLSEDRLTAVEISLKGPVIKNPASTTAP